MRNTEWKVKGSKVEWGTQKLTWKTDTPPAAPVKESKELADGHGWKEDSEVDESLVWPISV